MLSVVPQQETALVTLFFTVMIADIDQILENSISIIFADDTKVRTKVKSLEDTEHFNMS